MTGGQIAESPHSKGESEGFPVRLKDAPSPITEEGQLSNAITDRSVPAKSRLSYANPMTYQPIALAPRDDRRERALFLYCPEQGGWQAGVWFDGRWTDFSHHDGGP